MIGAKNSLRVPVRVSSSFEYSARLSADEILNRRSNLFPEESFRTVHVGSDIEIRRCFAWESVCLTRSNAALYVSNNGEIIFKDFYFSFGTRETSLRKVWKWNGIKESFGVQSNVSLSNEFAFYLHWKTRTRTMEIAKRAYNHFTCSIFKTLLVNSPEHDRELAPLSIYMNRCS